MKRHLKIIGSLGLALAMSVGYFAVRPASAADLIPLDKNNSNSAEVTIRVNVIGETPTINIAKPLDGAQIPGLDLPVSVDYTNANELKYELVYVAADGTKTSYNLPSEVMSATGNGTHSYNLDIRNYGGKYGQYILRAEADGSGIATDSVSFELISFDVELGEKDDSNNPGLIFRKHRFVKYALLLIYDRSGRQVIDTPIEVAINPDRDTEITVDMASLELPDGEYTIVATPYDELGNIAGVNKSIDFVFESVPAPEVPNTGSVMTVLGLSRSDMISTGLAVLIITAFFAILIIAKRSKSKR